MSSPELTPDPCLDEKKTAWSALHSLASLKLTLQSVLRDCTIPQTPPLLEFSLKTEVDEPPETQLQLPLRTRPPKARLQSARLSLKTSQLRSAVDVYQTRLNHLQQGSRAVYGEIWGHSVCLMVDTSSQHAFEEKEDEEGSQSKEEDCGSKEKEKGERSEFAECKRSLVQLFEEQLSQKNKVYILEIGPEEPDDGPPTPLNFRKHRQRSKMVAGEWVEGLKGSGGTCSLLPVLKKAVALTDIDTLLIVMGSRPREDKNTLAEFLRDRSCQIHIHWVAHLCDNSTREWLAELAAETGAHNHSYSQSRESGKHTVEDSEIDIVRAELKQAEEAISELDILLQSGEISDKVFQILIQLNIACCQFDHEPLPHFSTDDSTTIPVTSRDWLKKHSLDASGLNIYHVLAPNAYRQVMTSVTHSPDTLSAVPSVVYDEMMPRFKWHDGTLKYLHVDVHLLEKYQVQVEKHIMQLRQRLNWLTSGSRAPFGILAEKKVVLVVEFSGATLPFASQLQNCLRLLLLQEQLSLHTEEFNIMRIGEEGCCSWRPSLAQKTLQSLSDAWLWLLGQSPAGSTASLIPALEMAFNQGKDIGVYLILSSLPKENTEATCSFLRGETSALQRVNVVFYRQSPPTESHAVAGIRFEEGYYADEQGLTHCLQQIATAGNGRFHSFKGPDTVSGDDIEEVVRELQKAQDHLRMAESILSDYRSFCKRFVPPPVSVSPPPPSEPPPLYPRPTTAFLCRLNAASRRRIPRSVSDTHLSRRRHTQTQQVTRRTKTCAFYLDRNLEKGFALERWATFGTPLDKKPHKAESESIAEWLLKYSLESLGLKFSKFEGNQLSHRKTYRHINHKGGLVELYIDHKGLRKFSQRLRQARDHCSQKLRELANDWRNALGCVSESKVLFLIDTSSSMSGGYQPLQAALADFLQHRPHSLKYLNLVAYSSGVRQWQETLSPVNDETMGSAAEWLSQLRPEGSSCLLHALKLSLQSGVKTLYLITDGTADHTHDFLLSQLPQLRSWYGDQWKINTIAFHCSLESSFSFLRDLAHGSGGRYHSYPWGGADDSPAKLLQNRYLGDDVLKLVQEISSADDQLHKASQFF